MRTDCLIVITGPPGSGKSTLARILETEFGVRRIRPFTTRSQRASESPPNHDYVHVTREFAQQQIASNNVHSSDIVAGAIYGLLWTDLNSVRGLCSLIAPAGRVQQLRAHVNTLAFQLRPPGGRIELARRMRERGEDEEAIRKRIAWGEFDTSQLPRENVHLLTSGTPLMLAEEVMRIARLEEHV